MGTDKRFEMVGEVYDRLRQKDVPERGAFALRLRTFLNDPTQVDDETWMQKHLRDGLQELWQKIYDDLGIKMDVPKLPRLTANQRKSLKKFNFTILYVPPISEEQYPDSFEKLQLDQEHRSSVVPYPLVGRWVAVEVLEKPYNNDRLASAIRLVTRFGVSFNDLEEILEKVAHAMNFPVKRTRVPTLGDWNFIANLLKWLRDHRGHRGHPDLGINGGWEWTDTKCNSARHCLAGRSDAGGIGAVGIFCNENGYPHTSFRTLIEL